MFHPAGYIPTAPETVPTDDLSGLLGRVAELRRRASLFPVTTATPPWIAALGGRNTASGLNVAERRYPLWYRHGGRSLSGLLEPKEGLPFGHGDDGESIGFLSLLPARLDDGSPRILLATWGTLDDEHFLIRQALATQPGAEGTLLDWLHQEMAPCRLVVADGRQAPERALLASARQRHGMDAEPAHAWLDLGTGRKRKNPEITDWRHQSALPEEAAATLYRHQRDTLLGMASRLAG